MKKGFTLIEILISIAILSFITLAFVTMYRTNFNTLGTTSEELIAYDNLRNIEKFVVDRITNAEELEILDEVPDTFEAGYTYIFSENGGVYYVHDNSSKIKITDGSGETFETVFTKVDDQLLNIQMSSTTIFRTNKEVNVNLSNMKDTETVVNDGPTNVIKFIANLPEEVNLELVITYFSFKKSENPNAGKWLKNEYVGVIDQENLIIEVYVDEEVDITGLIPYVIHDGDKDIEYDVTSSGTTGNTINFINEVNATVTKNGVTKTYKVRVIKEKIPMLLEFGFKAKDNVTESYVGNNSNTEDRMGYINQQNREVLVTVDSIGSANRELVPYFKIEGAYIEINGQRMYEGDKKYIEFNEDRTFSLIEYATSLSGTKLDVKRENNSVAKTWDNDYTSVKPTIVTVYGYAADGVTLRSRSYEVYVSPYGYSVYLARKKSNGTIAYTAWIDQENLKIYRPYYAQSSSDRFVTRYIGSASSLKYGSTWYLFPDITNEVDEGNKLLTMTNSLNDNSSTNNNSDNDKARLNVYNKDVYDKAVNGVKDYYYVGKDDYKETDKFYQMIWQSAGIFKFHYENTEVQNRYLYKNKVEATITHKPRDAYWGHGWYESNIGNGNTSQMGEISVTFPQNEYLEDMVASFTKMGEFVGAVVDNNKKVQTSEVTTNNIANGSIREYYVKSENPYGDSAYFRYAFKINYSDAPTIEISDTKLIKTGENEKETLTVPDYTYIIGVNREEKEDGAEYQWYYVKKEDENKIGTDQGIPLDCDTKDFLIEDYKNSFLGEGYVYARVRTRSDTYTVNGKTHEYGGVYTNWVSTDGYYVNYAKSANIQPVYTVFGGSTDGTAIKVTNLDVDDSHDFKVHSNNDLALSIKNIKNSVISVNYVGKWIDRTWGSNGNYINTDMVLESNNINIIAMPDYHQYFTESINNNDVYNAGGSNVELSQGTGNSTSVNWGANTFKTWIVGKNIGVRGFGSNDIIRIMSEGGTIEWTASNTNGLGTAEEPAVIYQKGGGNILISGNFTGENYLFIYAPDSTVTINSNSFNATTSIIAKEVNMNVGTLDTKKMEEVPLP